LVVGAPSAHAAPPQRPFQQLTLQRTTSMADLEEKVKEIIAKELGVEREKLTNDASFMEDLGADSLDTVELVMEFEKEFNIDIPDEDAEKLRTVGDALNYLQTKVKA
jgi:acyl carrier protein